MMQIKNIIGKIAIIAVLLSTSGCATYKSSFSCSDAKGATCMPMDRVDRMIKSGEIEVYNKQLNAKNKLSKTSKQQIGKNNADAPMPEPALAKQLPIYHEGS